MNKRARNVPKVRRAESPEAPDDRRVQKTTRSLVHAMVQLALEKRWQSITIQNILDRADVGRSTFYAHYRDKDDLLIKSFERMLVMLDSRLSDSPTDGRLAPVRELFEHVAEVSAFHRAMEKAKLIDRLFSSGVNVMAQSIAARLAARADRRPISVGFEVESRALAAALFGLLRWWLVHPSRPTPADMDRHFHAMKFQAEN